MGGEYARGFFHPDLLDSQIVTAFIQDLLNPNIHPQGRFPPCKPDYGRIGFFANTGSTAICRDILIADVATDFGAFASPVDNYCRAIDRSREMH